MNPMGVHPMNMDRMIFDFNPSVFATSLYIILCSHIDEGERPTLNHALRAWNSTEENLIQAAKELIDLNILKSLEPLDLDGRLSLNPREKWSWCKALKQKDRHMLVAGSNSKHA